jgi:bacillithiol biosynthesis cysteine-adding enzyme BshC
VLSPALLSGDDGVIPDCISFDAIPHTSRLFTDFLSGSPNVQTFFPHQPDPATIAALAKSLPRDLERQAKVADVLDRQNIAWGASDAALRNIQRLRNGAFAVLSGQQTGLFGGPLYSIYKIASQLALVKQLEALGVDVVPVFWLASEDHDLAEVNQSLLLKSDSQLASFTAPVQGIDGAPVATIRFAAGAKDIVEQAAELLGDSLATDYLRASYAQGETFSDAFARLYARMFADHGLILLDPWDNELHRIAAPLLASAIDRSAELDDAILARNRELQAAGYHEQVKVTRDSTPLFAIANGARVPVHRANGGFKFGRELVSREEMLRRIENAPENFSANVLLRPVMQDYLLPTLAYVGGPAEIAYFAQLAVVYQKLLGRVTPVVSRLHATLIEPRIERLLTKYEVALPELFHGECQLRDCMAARALPPELKQNFDQARQRVDISMQQVRASLEKLDPTLMDAAERAMNKMRYQIERLRKRAAQAELRRTEVLGRHAAQIENALYPNKNLQEREISALYFFAKYGAPLLDRLIELAQGPCPDHKVLVLEP